jgi:hypothetical protein
MTLDLGKGRKIGWNIYRRCHEKNLPSNLYIVNWEKEVTQEDKKKFWWLEVWKRNALTISALADDVVDDRDGNDDDDLQPSFSCILTASLPIL